MVLAGWTSKLETIHKEDVNMIATTLMIECPVCAGDVDIAPDTVVNELLDCGECASELEVTSLDPPKFALAPEVAEDWGE